MDPGTMHEIWLNLATNSPFLAFLMYNWYQQTKQNEQYRLEMKADREAYEQKRESAIEGIRDRYVKVIEDLKAERKGGIEDRLHSVEKGIKSLFASLNRLKEEVNEIKLKEHVRDMRG